MLCVSFFTAEAIRSPDRQEPDLMPDWLALPGFFDVFDILLVAGIGWIARSCSAIGSRWRSASSTPARLAAT